MVVTRHDLLMCVLAAGSIGSFSMFIASVFNGPRECWAGVQMVYLGQFLFFLGDLAACLTVASLHHRCNRLWVQTTSALNALCVAGLVIGAAWFHHNCNYAHVVFDAGIAVMTLLLGVAACLLGPPAVPASLLSLGGPQQPLSENLLSVSVQRTG